MPRDPSVSPLLLSDLLVAILEAQENTLNTLVHLVGNSDRVLKLLEASYDHPQSDVVFQREPPKLFGCKNPEPEYTNYRFLAGYERLDEYLGRSKLDGSLHFHLVSFPIYRYWVESYHDLTAPYEGSAQGLLGTLDLILESAERWRGRLNLPAETLSRLETLARPFWLNFRAQVCKKASFSPLVLER